MPRVEIRVELTFSAAHRLPRYDGPCARPHGHNYRLVVSAEGAVDPTSGFVMDFEALRRHVWERALHRCDHHDLNGFLENPTAENIVVWIWNELKPTLPGLKELVLFETDEYAAVYRGEG